jgi:hypothetical protein
LSGDGVRLSLYTEKQLKLDFLVATIEQAWNRILLFKQKIQQLFKQLSRLWTWLNYGAHDFRRDSAHYMACSFSIVKPGAKVITIEPSADALSMEGSLTL